MLSNLDFLFFHNTHTNKELNLDFTLRIRQTTPNLMKIYIRKIHGHQEAQRLFIFILSKTL